MKSFLTIIALFSLSAPVLADVEKGKELFATCAGCHGAMGEGGVGPQLKGQSKEDIASKLHLYKEGKITTPMASMMNPMAAGLSDEDISNIGDFVASLSPAKKEVAKETTTTKTTATYDVTAGSSLYQEKTCSGCHGAMGEGAVGPKLAGRDTEELISLFKQYKEGTRDNGMASLMAGVVNMVSEEEVQNIAAYLNSIK